MPGALWVGNAVIGVVGGVWGVCHGGVLIGTGWVVGILGCLWYRCTGNGVIC